jgi:acyl phosphate:glycerol-3-phosphate acyltransferase
MNWISLISVPVAYLLGSISSAYIVAKSFGKIDIRDEADGHVSAAAVYRRVGRGPFMLTVFMDIGKAALAVLIAQWLGAAPEIVMLAGVVAIAGHQWSPFLNFRGGLGATAICGVLICVATIPTLIGLVIAGLAMLAIRKPLYGIKGSTAGFMIGAVGLAAVILLLQWAPFAVPPILIAAPTPAPPLTAYHLLIAFPVILALMMIIKSVQIKYAPVRSNAG